MSNVPPLSAPGAYRAPHDRWGRFEVLCAGLPSPALVVVDARVLSLHASVKKALARAKPRVLLPLKAGEPAKSLPTLERVLKAAVDLPRAATFLCVGGGTLGDLVTVAAHLHKRGARLIHVPTTLLAAVDSSQGGKGAVLLVRAGHSVKNALGVFHYADESWICEELFETLDERQFREGRIEAWKMALSLDTALCERWEESDPSLPTLVKDARAMKDAVCGRDPYEHQGLRQVLNFGHTFGHVIESLSSFRVPHGDAVGLGLWCALDVGRVMGVTPSLLAEEVESLLADRVGVLSRAVLARVLKRHPDGKVRALLGADKKVTAGGELRMVLLSGLGKAVLRPVPEAVWLPLVQTWRAGGRPRGRAGEGE